MAKQGTRAGNPQCPHVCARQSDRQIKLTQRPAEKIKYCRSVYMRQQVPSVACGMPATNFLEVQGEKTSKHLIDHASVLLLGRSLYHNKCLVGPVSSIADYCSHVYLSAEERIGTRWSTHAVQQEPREAPGNVPQHKYCAIHPSTRPSSSNLPCSHHAVHTVQSSHLDTIRRGQPRLGSSQRPA